MLRALALALTLTGAAHAATFYYAGEVPMTDSRTKKPVPVQVAYRREIRVEAKEAVEKVVSVFKGKRYHEDYRYDFKTGKLTITDDAGKIVSTTPFTCTGKFPQLKSCRYDFVSAFEVKGEDHYLPGKGIQFMSSVKDKKDGITYVTDGILPFVTQAEYEKKLADVQKAPLAE